MIDNQDNYLLLKQLLVLVQTLRSGVVVDLNGTGMQSDDVQLKVNQLLMNIEDNFTIPYFIQELSTLPIDFPAFVEGLSNILGEIEEGSDLHDTIMVTNEPDNLYRAVVDYPNLQFWIDEQKENLSNGICFHVDQDLMATVAKHIDSALLKVRQWVEGECSTCPVSQIVVTVNILQLLDELFQYTNDYYGVKNVQTS